MGSGCMKSCSKLVSVIKVQSGGLDFGASRTSFNGTQREAKNRGKNSQTC